MLAEGLSKPDEDPSDQQAMEEDLANDQSIDGKIEREVKKIAELTEKKLQVKIMESQKENISLIELLQK